MRATMRASMKASTPALPPVILLFFLAIANLAIQPAEAFSTFQLQPAAINNARCISLRATSASDTTNNEDDTNSNHDDENNDDGDNEPAKKKKGHSLRDATGIRPSLHPATINCVAEALLLRSQCVLGTTQTKDGQEISIDTANTETEPLQIAITAAGIAMAAIDQRSDAAKTDETTDVFSTDESQTISGRVIGVVMRLRELEGVLMQKVNGVAWVKKYGEEESFGVLKQECQSVEKGEEEENVQSSSESMDKQLAETIKINPLFRMNRAECLLALFLSTVEQPKLEQLGENVAGGSKADFIDADRLEVLVEII